MSKFFTPHHISNKSKARLGTISTVHGIINTPAFVPVGTKGTIKGLLPSLIHDIGVQVSFVNTYHLVTHPGADIIAKAGGIHTFSKLDIPIMSDSGGFQVFSLAQRKRMALFRGDVVGTAAAPDSEALIEKISEDGVKFRSTYDGALIEFTPETSIQFQQKIGADLIMAFDECTYYPATKEYTEQAMERTHEWLMRCIKKHKNSADPVLSVPPASAHSSNPLRAVGNPSDSPPTEFFLQDIRKQYLYGIIQGGMYEDLRKKSAEFVASQQTAGIAIGGVSVGEKKGEMRDQVSWVSDYLPTDRPVHLLGIGHADDIIDLVKYGIDTFDCVEPTRLARMGTIYQVDRRQTTDDSREVSGWEGIDITKTTYRNNLEKVDENCECYVCQNFTKAYIHHLFKQKELLGYTLATYHNLWVMEKFMVYIREQISMDLI